MDIDVCIGRLKALNFTILNQDKFIDKNLLIRNEKGVQYNLGIYTLNLNKALSIKILKSDFEGELNQDSFIVLKLIMEKMDPVYYLIPLTVFLTPNHIFINNEQPEKFSFMSNWEIKVFQRGLEELSKYTFEKMIDKLR